MTLIQVESTESYELWDVPGGDAPVVVSCEHGSARMPEGWSWPAEDLWLVGTHWSYDIGAADCARELAAVVGCPALLARFTRLLVDPNRLLDSPTLFRRAAEGRTVQLNARVDDADRDRRLARLYGPYHEAFGRVVASRPAAVVVAMHSFTPIYEGEARSIDAGVLFDRDEGLALHVTRRLSAAGFHARLNEPYSGRAGMMYAAQQHADAHGRPALELEVRQDLAASPPWRARFVRALGEALLTA